MWINIEYMQNLIDSLTKTGLSEKESLTYLTLLKYGSATVGTISRNSGIKRPTTYVILDELRKKGMVIEIPNSKKTSYQAKSPDEFYDQQLNKFESFEKTLPQLRSIFSDRKDIKTLYFEGFEGLKEAFFYKINMLKDSEVVGFYASAEGVDKKVIELTKQFGDACDENNIRLTGYTTEDESTKEIVNNLKQSFVSHVSTEIYSSESSIEISNIFIRIMDFHSNVAIIIENPNLAKTFKNIFKLASIGIEVEQNKS